MRRSLRWIMGSVVGVMALSIQAHAETDLCRMRGVGIYLQETPMVAAHERDRLKNIVRRRARRASEAELNLMTPYSFPQWKKIWNEVGLDPTEENSIIDFWHGGDWLGTFKASVRQAKGIGIKTVAPIFSPNGDNLSLDDFSTSSTYEKIREAALYGGALAVDAPPAYFQKRGSAYQNFTYDEIRWGLEHGLRVTAIISPAGDNSIFLGSVKSYLDMLAAHHALPTEWAIENYNSSDDNGVSCAASINTMAYVSAWLANKEPFAKQVEGKARRVRVFQGIASTPDKA